MTLVTDELSQMLVTLEKSVKRTRNAYKLKKMVKNIIARSSVARIVKVRDTRRYATRDACYTQNPVRRIVPETKRISETFTGQRSVSQCEITRSKHRRRRRRRRRRRFAR